MVRFVIIRHGYSVNNKEKRFSGQMDVPLDAIGYEQAQLTKDYVLQHFQVDSVYSSDLSRAYETVKPIADALSLPVIKCRLLREIDVGAWQGRPHEDVKREFPETYFRYLESPGTTRFENGENYQDVMDRAQRALREIAAENEGKTVVIGTHGGVVRALRACWDGVPAARIKDVPRTKNASVTVIEYENGAVRQTLVNYNEHLQDKMT